MKQSKTTLKELTAAYRAVLRHGILCNAIALGLIAVVPARAETITYSDFMGNEVTGQYGSALLNNGTATINGGTFSGNQTGAQGYGGAKPCFLYQIKGLHVSCV